MILPDASDRYKTFLGALMSLFTIFLLIFYSAYKLNTMFSFADYKIQQQELERYYNHTEAWGKNDSFAIAAAITAYDGGGELIEDPSIG